MASPAKTLRILCFGDSLTAGYSGMGAVYHPYSETLEQMVAMAFPEYRIETVEDGKPGDLASSRGSFLSRMGKICEPFTLLPFSFRLPLYPPSCRKPPRRDQMDESNPADEYPPCPPRFSRGSRQGII